MRHPQFEPAGETFMGVPACPDPARLSELVGQGVRAALLGVGMATPYRSAGAVSARAPAAIRAASAGFASARDGVNFDLGRAGWEPGAVVDCGDLQLDPADAAGNRLLIRHAVAAVLAAGAAPLVLGGDASVLVPVLQGCEPAAPASFAAPDRAPGAASSSSPGLQDAGRPEATPAPSPSDGPAVGRQPAAAAAAGPGGGLTLVHFGAGIGWREQLEGERWGGASALRRAAEMAHVGPILQIGARGPDLSRPADLAAARDRGVQVLSAATLRRGPGDPLAALPQPGAPVFLALEAGLFDPSIMPAVAAPRAGGLDYGAGLDLLARLAAPGRVRGAAVLGLVPDRDRQGRGALLAAQLVAALLGLMAAGG